MDSFITQIKYNLIEIQKASDEYKQTNNEKDADKCKFYVEQCVQEIGCLITRCNHFLECMHKDVMYKQEYYGDPDCQDSVIRILNNIREIY